MKDWTLPSLILEDQLEAIKLRKKISLKKKQKTITFSSQLQYSRSNILSYKHRAPRKANNSTSFIVFIYHDQHLAFVGTDSGWSIKLQSIHYAEVDRRRRKEFNIHQSDPDDLGQFRKIVFHYLNVNSFLVLFISKSKI